MKGLAVNGIWGHHELPSHAIHHGVMAQRSYAADYYTSQPDPGHWIAVGLAAPVDPECSHLRCMLVGEGHTEDEAIHALWVRIAELADGDHITVVPEHLVHREDTVLTNPVTSVTCARIYLAGGDRLTIPGAAFVREDPINGSLICTDADGCPIKKVKKDQVIGYLVFTCQPQDGSQA